MNPDVTANIFVLKEDTIFFLHGKKWLMSLVAVVVGVDSCPGTNHAPWADMNGTGIVEDGKFADNNIGFTPHCVKNSRGKYEFSFVNIRVGSSATFF